MTDDRKISQRYRELPREEPPRHVDEAILAAGRRAAGTRPRRWYIPLAAAAVVVLAVAVTVHVERQRPEMEVAQAPAPSEDRAPAVSAAREMPVEREPAPLADLQKAPARAEAQVQGAMRQQRAAADSVAGLAATSPEQWLQGIADLRRQGRHEEAERQLAEFRSRYPGYRIPETLLSK